MNSLQFAQLLVRHGVVDSAAVTDPTGYDNSATLDRIRGAFSALELETIRPLADKAASLRVLCLKHGITVTD